MGENLAEPFDTGEHLAGFPVVIFLPVVWGEMDSYQHVNNVVYFRYFETCRLQYVVRLGWPELEDATGIGPILHSTQARFRRPLTWPDVIAVGARLGELGDDRFTLIHRIVSRQQKAVTTEGQGLIVSFDYRQQRKVPLPEELRKRIRELEGRG